MPSIFDLNPAEWQGIAVHEIDLITNGLAGIGKITLRRGAEAEALGWDCEQTGALPLARVVIRASLPAIKPMTMIPVVNNDYGSHDVFIEPSLIGQFMFGDHYVKLFHAFWNRARTMKGGGAFLPYVSLGFASPVEMMQHAGWSVDDIEEAHYQIALHGHLVEDQITREECDRLARLLMCWFEAHNLLRETTQ